MIDEPRRIPIHRSLNRPNLILGGERALVLMTMLVSAMICFTAAALWQVGAGVFFWIAVHSMLITMAQSDPMMSLVYQRHIRYRPFYPARGGVDCIMPNVAEWKE